MIFNDQVVVVDTSVIVAVIANEPEKEALIARTEGLHLFAPQSVPFEIGNAFSAMLKRGRITLPQAQAALSIYADMDIELLKFDLSFALKLAHQLNIYAYDAYIIACASNLNCSLLSLDKGLIQAAKAADVHILESF